LTGKRLFRITAATVLSLAIVFSIPLKPVPAQADTLSELQQKQAALQQKSKELDSQLQKLKNDKTKQQQYLNTIKEQALNLEDQLESQSQLIQQLDAEILEKQNSIAAKQKEIDADFQKLKQRVYALYLTGEASNLEIILNAKNIMDLADKTQLLKTISEHDTALMNSIKSDIDSIKEEKTAIENKRKQASATKTQLQTTQRKLNALVKEQEQILATVTQNEQAVAAERAKNKAEQAKMASAIQNFLRSYKSDGKGMSTGEVSRIYSVASKYLKVKYVWGGNSPSGFDCSGFVSYVLKECGWSLNGAPRMTCHGLMRYCTKTFTSRSELRPGDLVFYNHCGHVGIYIGNNKAIQCDGDIGKPYPGVEVVDIRGYWQNCDQVYGRLP
jgi:peptidoglycan hydrolase CwlO-like protein